MKEVGKFNRNKEIKDLKGKLSIVEISKRYGISKQRVLQIQSLEEHECSIHGMKYYSSCRMCTNDKCDILKNNPEFVYAMKGITFEDRKKSTIRDLTELVRFLKYRIGLNATQIGRLVKRDRASVLHHLKNINS